jgi:lyso-ornithine lipid O-acyltransferase
MIGWIRAVFALCLVAAATPFFVLAQLVAMRTGLYGEHLAPRLWHRLILGVLGMRVEVHGQPAAARPLLLAANHISWTDIMVLGATLDVHFIAKAEMAGWPVIGFLSRCQRTIYVERERRRAAGEQAGEIAARLRRGLPIVLFAEGSTSDGNRVLPFKSTLFGAAARAVAEGAERVTIQPVALAYRRLHGLPMGRRQRPLVAWIGDQTLGPHILALLRAGPVDVELRFGAPMEFTAGSDRKRIARQAEGEVRRMLAAALHGRMT